MSNYKNLPTAEQYKNQIDNTIIDLGEEYSEPKYQCPFCNRGAMCRNEKILLTSNPPKRLYKCNVCERTDYQEQ